MSEKNLPIKLVLQKTSDTQKNQGGGGIKYFCEVTKELQDIMTEKFKGILSYYESVFKESELIPAVGKITVRPEAIAKSHKPNDFCRNCPIIGSEDLDEIYIKVSKKGIEDTLKLIKNPPSERFRANMTAITDIEPITANEKISNDLTSISGKGCFDLVRNKIKVKLFDFDNDFDNIQLTEYVLRKIDEIGLSSKHELITYSEKIKFIKVEVQSYNDIIKLAGINGVKSIDFFQEYSLPSTNCTNIDLQMLLEDNSEMNSNVTIGIIDGGISDDNIFLKSYVIAREEYVPKKYQNHSHATFIASTIQFGNELNGLETTEKRRFSFIDIVAIPNGDSKFGPTDSIGEEELMEIIEAVMQKHAATTKIWNLSLGIENKVCTGSMSDLGIFLDYIQDKYQVQIFVSSGNIKPPLREWPPQTSFGERDRIISPADSVRAITVGSIALYDSDDSIVKTMQPSPFSRRGPGANYIVKPDLVDYGGNFSKTLQIDGLGMKGLDICGKVIEGNGTSYSTPRAVQKFASIYDEMAEKDILLAKAMLIHSARMNSRDLLEQNQDNIKYYGFGMPSISAQDILQCSEDEVTLVFRQKVTQGSHLEMYDFPYPESLTRDGKYFGEIVMTLAYNPILDNQYGKEYCRTNIDVSFGVYRIDNNGKTKFSGCVPLESTWDEKFEKARVENGFKWSPIKSYYRKISKGIQIGDGWKIRIDMNPRNEITVPSQEFVLIITIKGPKGVDIYSEVINGLRERGYVTNNLETKQQIRQRQ